MFFLLHPYILKFSRWLFLVASGLVLLLCIAVAEKKYTRRVCKKIQIKVLSTHGQQFITEHEAYSYLFAHVPLSLHHTLLKDIKIKRIEDVIKSHKFVRSCSVTISWKGVVTITILPKRALARLVDERGSFGYIDEAGGIIPLSSTYTPRVMLLSSKSFCTLPLAADLCDQPEGRKLLILLRTIEQSPFLKAQINHIHISKKNELVLSMQLTRHKIYFGKIEDIDSKMEKLKLFHRVILPYKGWDTYKRITLKFDNQIVCE
jgi:cell division protein FtsQ